MCSVKSPTPTNAAPQYVHNPYLDGGAYGNSVDANRVGTSALTIGLDPQSRTGGVIGTGLTIDPSAPGTTSNLPTNPSNPGSGNPLPTPGIRPRPN